MKKFYVLITALVSIGSATNGYAQESSKYTSKWLFKVSGGVNIPLTNMHQNRETDYLIEYSDKTQMEPSLSATWFIRERFGIEAKLKPSSFNELTVSRKHFQEMIDKKYGENYYTSIRTPLTSEPNMGVSLGLVYRIETERMYFYPKFAIGITPFHLDWTYVNLKEKNTNNEYAVNYYPEKMERSGFTLIPSVSVGYKLSKRIWVDLSVNTSYFKANFAYDKTFENLYTKETQTEHISYNKSVFDTYASLGIVYVISSKKHKK